MHITKKILILISIGILFCVIISCEKAKKTDEEVATNISPERELPQQNKKFDLDSYETLLDGIWNLTGKPVTEGPIEEFVWGESKVNDECVIFRLVKADSPFINSKELFLFIHSVDLSNRQKDELKFQIVDNYHKDQGILTIKFINTTEIQFSATRDVFASNVQYGSSYYKVAGPGSPGSK